jgi:hypothetical protein
MSRKFLPKDEYKKVQHDNRIKQGLFTRAVIKNEPNLRVIQLVLYLVQEHYNIVDELCCPKITTIARNLNVSTATVKRSVSAAQKAGWLIVTDNRAKEDPHKRANSYTFV